MGTKVQYIVTLASWRLGQIALLLFWLTVDLAARVAPDEAVPVPEKAQYVDKAGETVCNATITPIPPLGQVSSEVLIMDNGAVDDLAITLDIPHTWVGDLELILEHQGVTVTLMDRPGVPASTFGCSGNNIDVRFLDEAEQPVEDVCPPTTPVLDGDFLPVTPLSEFDGLPLAGIWTLTIFDYGHGDIGTLEEWCINYTRQECMLTDLQVAGTELLIFGDCFAVDVYARSLRPGGNGQDVLLYESVPVSGQAALAIPFQYQCDTTFFVALAGGPVEPVLPPMRGPDCIPVLQPWVVFLLAALLAGAAAILSKRRRTSSSVR